MNEEDLEINDPRVEFLADYVLKTMKLRAERWLKMYSVEDNRQLCVDFFDKVRTVSWRLQIYTAQLLLDVSVSKQQLTETCSKRVTVTMLTVRKVAVEQRNFQTYSQVFLCMSVRVDGRTYVCLDVKNDEESPAVIKREAAKQRSHR